MKLIDALLLMMLPFNGFAMDQTPTDLKAYLDQLQIKVDHAAQRSNQPASGGASVVGLRGAPQTSAAAPLYWKGKEKPMKVSADELKVFRSALVQAQAGQKKEAAASLQSFQSTYPHSALAPDVDETLKRLQ